MGHWIASQSSTDPIFSCCHGVSNDEDKKEREREDDEDAEMSIPPSKSPVMSTAFTYLLESKMTLLPDTPSKTTATVQEFFSCSTVNI